MEMGGEKITYTPFNYMWENPIDATCLITFMWDKTGHFEDTWILGDPFLRG